MPPFFKTTATNSKITETISNGKNRIIVKNKDRFFFKGMLLILALFPRIRENK